MLTHPRMEERLSAQHKRPSLGDDDADAGCINATQVEAVAQSDDGKGSRSEESGDNSLKDFTYGGQHEMRTSTGNERK